MKKILCGLTVWGAMNLLALGACFSGIGLVKTWGIEPWTFVLDLLLAVGFIGLWIVALWLLGDGLMPDPSEGELKTPEVKP